MKRTRFLEHVSELEPHFSAPLGECTHPPRPLELNGLFFNYDVG